tara:strand:- start:672 stop:1031 length:360 start_codon:yes stop_codon:yes gene_type:complete
MALTQITTQVISSNAATEPKLANDSVGTRQLIDGSVTLDKLAGNSVFTPFTNTSASSGTSNVFFIQGPEAPLSADYVFVNYDGVVQPQQEWVYNSGNDSIQAKDATFAAGITVDITAWY